MATGTAAIAAKIGKRVSEPQTATKKTAAKKNGKVKTKKEVGAPSKSRADIPWRGIADAYNSKMSIEEISKKFKLYRPLNKKGKENPYPNYLVVGYLTKLSHGVEVDGKTIQITRGNGGKKKKSAKKG